MLQKYWKLAEWNFYGTESGGCSNESICTGLVPGTLLLWILQWGITSWGSTIIFPISQMTWSKLPKITQLVTDLRQPLNLGNLAQEPVLFNHVPEKWKKMIPCSIKACQNVNECSNSPASLAGCIVITVHTAIFYTQQDDPHISTKHSPRASNKFYHTLRGWGVDLYSF